VFHHRRAEIRKWSPADRGIDTSCRRVATITAGKTMRGWKYRPSKCMAQASGGSSAKPCCIMKFVTARVGIAVLL
jgi:hypothetical protein